jgi:glycerophosphoryl diester phosphodiesterase
MTPRQRNGWLMVVVLLAMPALLLVPGGERSRAREATHYFNVPEPMVIAHQGGDALRPGNTLLAFAHADQLGVDVLEMDVHSTRDGVLVLMHDATVDRTTDGHGPIAGMDYAAVQVLDAAWHWPFDGHPSYRGKGVRVPALEAVLRRFPDRRFNIELKQEEPSVGAAVCAVLRRTATTSRTLVASFHRAAIQDFRTACPEVATSAHRAEVATFLGFEAVGLAHLWPASAEALQLPPAQYGLALTSAERIRSARSAGVHVDIWTLNDQAGIEAAFARGVNGVITDRPDLAMQVRERLWKQGLRTSVDPCDPDCVVAQAPR